MKITDIKIGDIVFIRLDGKLNAATTGEFEEKLMGIIDQGVWKIGVDMSLLDYINSSGLRVFLMAAKKLKKSDGNIVLFSLKDHVKEVFEMTGFASLIPIVESEEEAMKLFNE